MVRTIDVPEEIDRSLSERAEQEGTSVEALTVNILRDSVSKDPKTVTPAEIVEYWKREGLIGWRTDIEDSAVYAREIREKAQRRER